MKDQRAQPTLIGSILEDLSKRDSRFRFIKESFDEFRYGEFARQLEAIASNPARPDEDRSSEEKYMGSYLAYLSKDLINSTIYELLNVFDIDLTLDQVLEADDGNVGLLKALHKISESLVPQPAKTASLDNPIPNPQKRGNYQYPNRLQSSNIRVLRIQPGLNGSLIECQLEERNIDNDSIEEALSYVWGKPVFDKTITIDGIPFDITTNLYNILHRLRRKDITRMIWIDAICINQSDVEEKGHQVRLMRDIYSKALETNIWIGDWPTEQMIPRSDLMENPGNILAPVPENFGGHSMDQYDLVHILKECLEYQITDTWDEIWLKLNIMLVRCVNVIMMHEWWERTWTIQEAALPPNEPIIHFRSYQFPYNTLVAATNAATKLFKDIVKIHRVCNFTEATSMTNIHVAFNTQVLHWGANRGSEPLLRMLRPEKGEETFITNPWDRCFSFLLSESSTYRATDPRDKIFALESLTVESERLLINVDYNESTEAVFRRITARYLNQFPGDRLLRYKLSIEPNSSFNGNAPGPSWVHDFAYSDARKQSINMGQIDLYGHLLRNSPVYEPLSGQAICFATPKTLFCSGISTSAICTAKLITDLGENPCKGLCRFLEGFLSEALEEWIEGATADSLLESRMSFPAEDDIMKLLTLGSPLWRKFSEEPNSMILAENYKYMSGLFSKITGTYLFATRDQTIGLATAPVQKGDILSIIHRYPGYVILRGVKCQGESQDVEKYRIVARAAITENQDKMRARIDKGLQERVFQII
ncbi:heterokaryon incompatibility protein-domain-containing protein [Annulohypoxylon maeteangense]|uniref:heterokaryon incompatibility protein-domain-containing protein n=1 Tax=Annulohypoxylon maeteangense TaxID=1927788 RepID=UPI0020087FF0|nr:heterokaryon incompatibility protein-domain-containing protein [Annulohypoxylon maeteangense]KAI0883970.1 heterokaryon incompatibility protein-domain-containing protein [Annulohypoxylon maeteangense]